MVFIFTKKYRHFARKTFQTFFPEHTRFFDETMFSFLFLAQHWYIEDAVEIKFEYRKYLRKFCYYNFQIHSFTHLKIFSIRLI